MKKFIIKSLCLSVLTVTMLASCHDDIKVTYDPPIINNGRFNDMVDSLTLLIENRLPVGGNFEAVNMRTNDTLNIDLMKRGLSLNAQTNDQVKINLIPFDAYKDKNFTGDICFAYKSPNDNSSIFAFVLYENRSYTYSVPEFTDSIDVVLFANADTTIWAGGRFSIKHE